MSCNAVAIWRTYFVWVMSAVCLVMFCYLCRVLPAVNLIILHRTILNMGLASSMSYNVFAVCRPCFVWVVPTACLVMLLSGDHASCRPCFMQALPDVCHVMLLLSCRPCFVQVVPAVCLVMLMLSGDHASGGSCQQYVLWCQCCVKTMLHVSLASSMLCDVITIW